MSIFNTSWKLLYTSEQKPDLPIWLAYDIVPFFLLQVFKTSSPHPGATEKSSPPGNRKWLNGPFEQDRALQIQSPVKCNPSAGKSFSLNQMSVGAVPMFLQGSRLCQCSLVVCSKELCHGYKLEVPLFKCSVLSAQAYSPFSILSLRWRPGKLGFPFWVSPSELPSACTLQPQAWGAAFCPCVP